MSRCSRGDAGANGAAGARSRGGARRRLRRRRLAGAQHRRRAVGAERRGAAGGGGGRRGALLAARALDVESRRPRRAPRASPRPCRRRLRAVPAEVLATLPPSARLSADGSPPARGARGSAARSRRRAQRRWSIPRRGRARPARDRVHARRRADRARRRDPERHVELGHVIVMDPADGRVLAYASTDRARSRATRTYPAASLMKVVTAAAALERAPEAHRSGRVASSAARTA